MSYGPSNLRPSEPAILAHLVERHAQEAAFLWQLRDEAARSPAHDLESLSRLDERVEANLDGLRIAGEAGWEISRAALAAPRSGEVFAATVLAVERRDAQGLAEILARAVPSPKLARAVVSALGWVPWTRVEPILGELLAGDAPRDLHVFGIAGAAAHRRNPSLSLGDALQSGDPRITARALRAIGELGQTRWTPELRREMESDDEGCRFWAAWSAGLVAVPGAHDVLWTIARGRGPFAERACDMMMRCLEVSFARARVRELAADMANLRTALVGAAALGDPALVPWLIECMAIPAQARFAGWAFTMITGASLTADKLEGRAPSGFRAGPTDDPEDEHVAMDPDRGLPWPDVAAVRAHWDRRGPDLDKGERLLLGQPLTRVWLKQVLRGGSQPARAAAALESAVLRPGQPLFAVRAPALRQERALLPG
ncbi:MAG: TIGR02270 family protein [Minicystis sp.]